MLASNIKANRDILRNTLFDPETNMPRSERSIEILLEVEKAVEEIRDLSYTRMGKFDLPKAISKNVQSLAYYRAISNESDWLKFVGTWTLEGKLSRNLKQESLKLIESEFEMLLADAKEEFTPDNVTIVIVKNVNSITPVRGGLKIEYIPIEEG